MENKSLSVQHGQMMFYSREIMELKSPREMNIIFYTTIILLLMIFTGLFTIKINDVIKVPGIVRSQENNSEVKNVISGTITSINFKANQLVHKGDVLLSIDDSQYNASKQILQKELSDTNNELLFTQELLNVINTGTIRDYNDDYVKARIDDYLNNLNYLKRQLDFCKYQYNFQKNLPQTIQTERELKEVYYQYKLKKDEFEKFKTDNLSMALQNQKNLELKINQLNQDIIKLDNENSHLFIKAPVSGYIQELSSLNIGDYISAGHLILKIIPLEKQDFKVELTIPTKDIGEITEGMEVKYRLSAFPFFEYKGASGRINAIDPDVRQDRQNRLFYCVFSDIDKTSFSNYQGKEYPLRSGIEVDARIVMEKITIASYILRKIGIEK